MTVSCTDVFPPNSSLPTQGIKWAVLIITGKRDAFCCLQRGGLPPGLIGMCAALCEPVSRTETRKTWADHREGGPYAILAPAGRPQQQLVPASFPVFFRWQMARSPAFLLSFSFISFPISLSPI